MDDRVSAIPADALQAANDALTAAVEALAPHLVELSARERRRVLKFGDQTLAFATKALRYARERPELVPSFVAVDEVEGDLATYAQLDAFSERLRQAEALVRDTAMVAGGEAHAGALALYRAFQGAERAAAPGVDMIVKDLGERFVRGPRSSDPSSDAPQEPGEAP